MRPTTTLAVLAAGAALLSAAPAHADPEPPAPPVPAVDTFMPVNPANYTVNGGKWYAFAGPAGVVCFLDNLKGEYGCAGALPGAPGGANLVSAGPSGAPAFSTTDRPIAATAGPVNPLPPNTRLSFRNTFCGVDELGTVACLNTREQVGFVIAADSTYLKLPPPPPPPPPPAPVAPPPGG